MRKVRERISVLYSNDGTKLSLVSSETKKKQVGRREKGRRGSPATGRDRTRRRKREGRRHNGNLIDAPSKAG